MSKVTLLQIGSISQNPTTAADNININSATIQTEFDNTLSRDGTSPNQMNSDLDMNSNAILNLPAPANPSEPLRLADLTSFVQTGTVQIRNPNSIYASDYGVKGDGGDYTTQGQAAINAAAGLEVVWPIGSIGTKGWTYSPSANESPGLQFSGAGPEMTTFNYIGTPGGYTLTANTGGSSEFEYFLKIRDCRFSGAGIHLASIDYSEITNCYFRNISSGDGIHFTGGGDPDSSAQITIRNCFFGAIPGWGVYAVPSGSNTEISNLDIKDTDFWACGTSSTNVPPTSGGVAWRGIQGTIDNVGFTECQNVGVYVAQSGTAQQLILRNVDFENCESTVLPSFYCDTGLRICRMENIQFLQGNAPLVNVGGAWFTNTISNLTIDGVTVRVASANNPWTAFKATGTPITDTNRIRNVWWQQYDGSGQARYSGFTFDPIAGQGQFLISALNTAKLQSTGVGATMPMYLGGPSGNGEYVSYQIPSGGVTFSTGVLTPSTTYYFYLYNSADVNTTLTGTLTASTTAPTITFPGGYYTKTGDPSMIFIGQWITDGSGNFQTGGTGSSWYPALNATLSNGGIGTVLVGQGPATTPVFTRSPQLGVAGSAAGSLVFANATSGTVTIAPPTGALGSVTNTVQAVTDTFVYRATTDTLTNKTLTTPNLTSPNIGTGNPTAAGNLGYNTSQLNVGDGLTNHPLVSTDQTQTLTNKTISGASNTLSSIANGSLTNSSLTVGSTNISLGATAVTIAGLTLTAPVLGTPTSGTLTNCTGLPNAGLVNSSVTIGSTNVALGATAATVAGLTLTAPVLGTPTSGVLTNCTGLPVSTGISGLGTGVATALAVNTGTAGSHIVNGGVLGTPSSGTLTNCTGLPNAGLVNSSITIGSTAVSLGSTITNLVAMGTIASGAHTITATSANSLAVGANGTTNPVLNVDASTASVATGWNFKGAAAAGGAALSVLSSGTNEKGTIDGKGSGNLLFQTVGTGNVGIQCSNPISSLVIGGVGGSNAGFEISVSSAITFQSYNRNTSAYATSIFAATQFQFQPSGNTSTQTYILPSGCLSVGTSTDAGAGSVNANGVVVTKGYTVATLPSTAATGKIQGAMAFVTDALAPSFLTTVAGGGAVVTPVFYNGTNWVGA